MEWIKTSEQLPPIGQWVLVSEDDTSCPVEIMCYQGIKTNERYQDGKWEDYEYPSWTSGHGDIQDEHPKAWMPLPEPYREV